MVPAYSVVQRASKKVACDNLCIFLTELLLLRLFHMPVVTKVKTHIDLVKDTNFINTSAKDPLNTFIAK